MKTLLRNSDYQISLGVIFLALVMLGVMILTTGCGPSFAVPGPQGLPGSAGPKGTDGSTPTISTQPAPASTCLNGGTEILVNNVQTAVVCNGSNGSNGLNGSNGSDASIKIVQFCKGTTKYPSEFNEVGFLIDGKIYGVYSINNGALVYLPPGAYSSNVLNSSCSFVINADNTISD